MTKIQSLRSRAFHAQQERCFYCNFPMWNDGVRAFARRFRITVRQARPNRCMAEHLLVRCDGGQDSAENVVKMVAFTTIRFRFPDVETFAVSAVHPFPR